MKHHRHVFALCAVALSLSACEKSSRVELGEVIADSIQGVVDLAISQPAAQEGRLSSISGLALLNDGAIAIADIGLNQVLLFDSSGTYVATLDRKGSGPGDLLMPCCLAEDADGLLWVQEFGNRRYSAFEVQNAKLSFRRMIKMPTEPTSSFSRVGLVGGQGIAHLARTNDEGTYLHHIVDLNSRVLEVDSLKVRRGAKVLAEVSAKVPGGVRTNRIAQPFGANHMFSLSSTHTTASADGSEAVVRWTDVRNSAVRVLTFDASPPALSSQERRDAEEAIDAWARKQGVSRSSVSLGPPKHKPAIVNIGFDRNDRLWVELSVSEGQDRVARVYSSADAPAILARWPASIELAGWEIKDSVALGVETLTSGQQRVVRVRFTRSRR